MSSDIRLKEDSLFEDWVRLQLSGIESWQASSAQGEVRNSDLSFCLWQRKVGEDDCFASEALQYPLSFRLKNGYLLSSGVRFPKANLISWRLLQRMMKGLSGGFGYDENWRPCAGEYCRFEVFTAFVPKCERNLEVCGRAESLEVSYAIISRQMNRRIWQPYVRVISNLNFSRMLEPVIFQTENIFGLAPLGCRTPSLAPLTQDDASQLKCGMSISQLKSICREAPHNPQRLYEFGLCENNNNCQEKCKKLVAEMSEPCDSEQLQMMPRSPDLFRCQGKGKFLYLKSPIDLQADAQQGVRGHLFFRAFGIDADFCITRDFCLGRFAEPRRQNKFQPFLEIP